MKQNTIATQLHQSGIQFLFTLPIIKKVIMTKLSFFLLFIFTSLYTHGLNVTIIESQSSLMDLMDQKWINVITNMGHTGTIVSQSTLDNNSFFSSTDILIVSSGSINLPTNRINTILQFIQSGKPVYLQSEYLPTYSTNQAFAFIVASLGGSFTWSTLFSDNINPMQVLGTFSTTNNAVSSLDFYWHSVSGYGDCNIINFLEYGGAYHGFHFIPANNSYGSIITTTDQDWIVMNTSPQLMENIITHLITPDTVYERYNVFLGNDTNLCQGETLALNANISNATYLWQDYSTGMNFTVSQSGTYWVRINVNNCIITDTIQVTYNLFSVNYFGNDTTLCQGDTLNLDVTNQNATCIWQDNSTNFTYLVTQPGIYWVIMDINNCIKTDTIHVNYNPLPTVDVGNDSILCQGQTLTLEATTLNATYLWQDNSTNQAYTVTQPGTYWVKVDVNNCSIRDTININYTTSPIVNIGNDTTLCQGKVLTLDATSPNALYQWQNNSSSSTYTVTQSGTYSVKVMVNNCSVSDTIIVSYNPLPTIDFGNDSTLCQGEVLILDATNPNAIYLWQDSSTSPTYSITQQGTYWVDVSNICDHISDTINVNYTPLPFVNIGNDTTLCQGEILILDASNSNATYQWQDNSTSPTFTATQQGVYWVNVMLNNCNTKDTIDIGYNLLPNVDFGNDTILCQGEILFLDATTTNGCYLWQDKSTNPVFKVVNPGTFVVEVTNGCGISSDIINIEYKDCNCYIYIPTAFSPDFDNINDEFSVESNCVFFDFNLIVFNRWGEELFNTKNSNDSWNGTYNGELAPIGIYTYLVIYKFEKNTKEKRCGTIYLIR